MTQTGLFSNPSNMQEAACQNTAQWCHKEHATEDNALRCSRSNWQMPFSHTNRTRNAPACEHVCAKHMQTEGERDRARESERERDIIMRRVIASHERNKVPANDARPERILLRSKVHHAWIQSIWNVFAHEPHLWEQNHHPNALPAKLRISKACMEAMWRKCRFCSVPAREVGCAKAGGVEWWGGEVCRRR